MMRSLADQNSHGSTADFIDTLSSFSRLHRAQRWEGTFGEYLANIVPQNPASAARTSGAEGAVPVSTRHGRSPRIR